MDGVAMGKMLFGIHCHQPVENFHNVVNEAVERAYKPFILEALKEEKFKFSVHFSGWLLEFIRQHHGELFEALKKLSDRGQIEFFTGGFYEPILATIPKRWRKKQIEKLSSYIENHFGQTPKGLWLAERVWDDSIIRDLAECGISYVLVDDYHFLSVGFKSEQLNGYFLTESEGYKIKVYPIDKTLRYIVPFKSVREIADYMKKAGTRVIFDDGEKFGIWPGTYKWVYEDRWLKEFLSAVSEGLIETELFREHSVSEKPAGLAYLPTASYYEMGQWALPPESFEEAELVKEVLKRAGLESLAEKFVKGSIFKNFFVKYSESNYMHKRMLYLSKACPPDDNFAENLMKAQCNDVFWHGIFGGIYLPNLRDNFYRFLISAHVRKDEVCGEGDYYNVCDIDYDGYDEVFISHSNFYAVFSAKKGGSLYEFSLKDKKFNLLNVITRRKEGYHGEILKSESRAEDGISTIHEIPHTVPESLKERIIYDWHDKLSFISHFSRVVSEETFRRESFGEISDFANQPFELSAMSKDLLKFLREGGIFESGRRYSSLLTKEFNLLKDGISLKEVFETSCPGRLFHILELNLHFLTPTPNIKRGKREIVFKDEELGKLVRISADRDVNILTYPIETVSQNESGVGLTVQGFCVGISFEFEQGFEFYCKVEVKDV